MKVRDSELLGNRAVEQAIVALRRGEEGSIGVNMRDVADFFLRNLEVRGEEPPPEVVRMFNSMHEAQQRADWIRLADVIEYELLGSEWVGMLPFRGIRLEADPVAGQELGKPVVLTTRLATIVDEVEIAFGLRYLGPEAGSPYQEQQRVRDHSPETQWTWIPEGHFGIYRIWAWARRKGAGRGFDVFDSLDYEIIAPQSSQARG